MILKLPENLFCVLFMLDVLECLNDSCVTLTSSDSYAMVVGYEGSYNMNISLQLCTWQQEGVLVRHKFSSQGSLTISLHKGVVKAVVTTGDDDTVMEYYNTVSDGEWHGVEFFLAKTVVWLAVDDGDTVRGILPARIRTGEWLFSSIVPSYFLCRELLHYRRRGGRVHWLHEEPGD